MSAAGPAVSPTAVRRLSLAILRRHALAFALLMAALAVAPRLALEAAVQPLTRALAAPAESVEEQAMALALYGSYLGGLGLIVALSFAADAAVVLIALGADRRPGPIAADLRGIALRFVPVAIATWIACQTAFSFMPPPLGLAIYAVVGCWSVVVPVYAAERPPASRLAARTWAVLAAGGRSTVAILAVYCVLAICIGAADLRFGAAFTSGGTAAWAGRLAFTAAAAAISLVAEVGIVAVYREARRVERATPPPDVVAAFE